MAMGRVASDTNIILGGLLLFWGALAELYLLAFHQEPAGCTISSVPVGSICVTTWYWVLIPAVAGFIMLLVGTVNRPIPAEAEDLVRTDPFTFMILACFFTLTATTTILLLVTLFGDPIGATAWPLRGGPVDITNGLAASAAASGLVFFVGYGIHMAHVQKRRRFIEGYTRAVARHRQRGSA